MQAMASNMIALSGGVQSGKNGCSAYLLNVRDTTVMQHGFAIVISIHILINAQNGPKVCMTYA